MLKQMKIFGQTNANTLKSSSNGQKKCVTYKVTTANGKFEYKYLYIYISRGKLHFAHL